MAKSIEEQRKAAQAQAARLEDRDYTPEEEKRLEKIADFLIGEMDKKNAKSGK